jgi:hypothetical protein
MKPMTPFRVLRAGYLVWDTPTGMLYVIRRIRNNAWQGYVMEETVTGGLAFKKITPSFPTGDKPCELCIEHHNDIFNRKVGIT